MTCDGSISAVAGWWRVLAFLRKPWCGVGAGMLVVVSVLALVFIEPYQSDIGSALYLSVHARVHGCYQDPYLYIELRSEGAVVLETGNENLDAIETAISSSPWPVFLAVPYYRSRDHGWWAPIQHTTSWRIRFEAIRNVPDATAESAARLALVQHGNRAGWGVPPELANGDVVHSTILWSGVVWNTATLLAAGVFFWSLSGVPSLIRAFRARRAGLCEQCRYPLAGLVPTHGQLTCPECGRTRPS